VAVHGDAATLLAIDRRGSIMERVELQEPVPETSPPPTPFPFDENRQWHPPPRTHDAPLLGLSAAAPSPLSASSQPAEKSGSGALILLWLSSVALLAGLIMLTRDLRPPHRRRAAPKPSVPPPHFS
jgi:hypothetical protein